MDFLKKFGIEIKNKELLLQALTHSSYSNEHNVKNYERLEFLGDAVLQILMSDYLYNNMDLGFCSGSTLANKIYKQKQELLKIKEKLIQDKEKIKDIFEKIEEIEKDVNLKLSKINIEVIKEADINEFM